MHRLSSRTVASGTFNDGKRCDTRRRSYKQPRLQPCISPVPHVAGAQTGKKIYAEAIVFDTPDVASDCNTYTKQYCVETQVFSTKFLMATEADNAVRL